MSGPGGVNQPSSLRRRPDEAEPEPRRAQRTEGTDPEQPGRTRTGGPRADTERTDTERTHSDRTERTDRTRLDRADRPGRTDADAAVPRRETGVTALGNDELVIQRRSGDDLRPNLLLTGADRDPRAPSAITGDGVSPVRRDVPHAGDVPSFRASIEASLPDPTRSGVPPDAPSPDPSRLRDPGPVDPFGRQGPLAPDPRAAPVVSPERRAQLDQFSQGLAGERLTEYGRSLEEGRRVADAVAGRSALGPLSRDEQRYLIDQNLTRWSQPNVQGYDRNINFQAIRGLAAAGRTDPAIQGTVADAFAQRAVSLSSTLPGTNPATHTDRALAATLATHAVDVASTPENQRAMLERLGPGGSAELTRALALNPEQLRSGGSFAYGSSATEEERMFAGTRLLDATRSGPPTPATAAVVNQAFQDMSSRAYDRRWPGNPPRALGQALAHQWYPQDPARAASEGARLEGVFNTRQGQELVAGDRLSSEARLQNLDLIRQHPEWDRNFLSQRDSAYDIPAVAQALARPQMDAYGQLRGDAPQTLRGSNLENTIGFSMGLPPQGIPPNETPAARDARERAVAEGRQSLYQGDPAQGIVRPVADAIRNIGGADPRVTVVPVQFASSETGPVQLPLYRVADARTGQDRFVDNTGRTYQNLEDWRTNNRLPPGSMTYPEGGRVVPNAPLRTENTPRTIDTFGERVGQVADGVALVGGIVAGGAVIVGSGGTAAPIVLGAAAAWQTYRGVEGLTDRAQHGQSLNPFTDAGARAEWLNVGAGALSLASLGASGLAGRAISAGSRYSVEAATAASVLRVGANVADTAAAANAGHQLVTRWDELSGADRAQLALSVGFWGAGAAAGARLNNGRVGDMYNVGAMRDGLLYGHLDPQVRARITSATEGRPDRVYADLASRPEFRALAPEAQLRYLQSHEGTLRTPGIERIPAEQRGRLLDGLDTLPPQNRTRLLEGLRTHAGDPAALGTLAELGANPGFGRLAPAEQRRILDLVRGTNAEVSRPAREMLQRGLVDQGFRAADANGQASLLRGYLNNQPWLPQLIDAPTGTYAPRAQTTLGAPRPLADVGFASGSRAGTVQDLQIDGRTVRVVTTGEPPPAGTSLHTVEDVRRALASLPPEARAAIREVHIDPRPSAHDAYWAQQFGDPNHRAYMEAGNGVVTIHPTSGSVSLDRMTKSIAHEVGHFVSSARWGSDSTQPSWQPWRDAIQRDGQNLSRYGNNNAAEDFSEATALFLGARGTPREAELRRVYPARFALLDAMFPRPPSP